MSSFNDHEWVIVFFASVTQAMIANGVTRETAENQIASILENLFSLDSKNKTGESLFTTIRRTMTSLDLP